MYLAHLFKQKVYFNRSKSWVQAPFVPQATVGLSAGSAPQSAFEISSVNKARVTTSYDKCRTPPR